jgi:hypothetical protein
MVLPRDLTSRVQWVTTRGLYQAYENKINQYRIRSAALANGYYLVTSRNIRMQVLSIGAQLQGRIPGDAASLNRLLHDLRQAKDADDYLAYAQGTAELQDAAINSVKNKRSPFYANGFFLSEQHCVWAMAASARVGCILPPEWFIDSEAFGGTAGNGPDILYAIGGYIGGGTSTIAMGHDTDWMLGRLFGISPLGGLARLRPRTTTQLKRMGAAGLFGPNNPLLAGRDGLAILHLDPRAGAYIPRDVLERERAAANELKRNVHDPIDALLTACNASNVNYTNPDVMGNALKQGQHGWSVKYRDVGEGFQGGLTLNDGGYDDFGGYLTGHEFRYRWDGNESQTSGKQDVRNNNRRITPHFSSLVRI